MSDRLAPQEADRLRRAERRWLEQAHERLRRPAHAPRPASASNDPEETER